MPFNLPQTPVYFIFSVRQRKLFIMWFIRLLIIYCSKRALKYDQMKAMLLEQEGLRFIYAVGTMVYNRNIWLKRVEWLSKTFCK
jgi:hypothetical protein